MSPDESLSSPQEGAHPGQMGHAPWISLPTGKWRWPQPLHRARSGSSRPGPTAGHLPGICSPPVSDWHSGRSGAIWTAPAHESQPVRGVVIRSVGLFAQGQVLTYYGKCQPVFLQAQDNILKCLVLPTT